MSRLADAFEVLRHKIAFYRVRSTNPTLKDNISLARTLLHDTGKMINILVLGDNLATKIHRAVAGHHKFSTTSDLWEAVCDWECARFTKPSKPLNARDTWVKYYNYLPCQPLLDKANL